MWIRQYYFIAKYFTHFISDLQCHIMDPDVIYSGEPHSRKFYSKFPSSDHKKVPIERCTHQLKGQPNPEL